MKHYQYQFEHFFFVFAAAIKSWLNVKSDEEILIEGQPSFFAKFISSIDPTVAKNNIFFLSE